MIECRGPWAGRHTQVALLWHAALACQARKGLPHAWCKLGLGQSTLRQAAAAHIVVAAIVEVAAPQVWPQRRGDKAACLTQHCVVDAADVKLARSVRVLCGCGQRGRGRCNQLTSKHARKEARARLPGAAVQVQAQAGWWPEVRGKGSAYWATTHARQCPAEAEGQMQRATCWC